MFLSEPDLVLYQTKVYELHVMDLNGIAEPKFDSEGHRSNPVLVPSKTKEHLITAESDGSIRIHNAPTCEV